MTQPEPTLVELIRYNQWANEQVLTICIGLDKEKVSTPIPGAYGSIHRTLGHMLYAEADYIGRITGAQPQPPFKWEEGPSLEQLRDFAAQVGQAFLEVVERTEPTQMVHEEENGLFIDYQARQLFMQLVIHGIEHRTNVTTHLTMLGVALPELDGWGNLFAHPDRFELREGKV